MSCQQLTQLKIESLINNPTWIGMLELFPSGFRLFRQLWPTTTFTPCNLFVSLDVYWVVMQPRGSNWCHQKVTTHSAICERIISYEITKHLKFLPCQSEVLLTFWGCSLNSTSNWLSAVLVTKSSLYEGSNCIRTGMLSPTPSDTSCKNGVTFDNN